jgi:putative transposase
MSVSAVPAVSCVSADRPPGNASKAATTRYPKCGYPTLHDMLVLEERVINRKRAHRIYYREEGLQVRTKKRKKIVRPRVPMLVPDAVDERWSIDFMSSARQRPTVSRAQPGRRLLA